MHPETIVESHIRHGTLFGLNEDKCGQIHKWHIYPNNIATINGHLDDQPESHMSAKEEPTAADDIKRDGPLAEEDEVRNMLCKHENIWSGALGERKATKLRIDVKQDAIPSKALPCQARPKTG